MHHIAAEVGAWDVFILNAGHIASPASITSADLSDYWKTYEVCPSIETLLFCPYLAINVSQTNHALIQTNVKSVVTAANAFLPTANKTHATMLGVIAGALVFPPASTPGLSAYLISKMAAVKTLEFLAVENPGVFIASVHPGMVDTGLFRKSGAAPEMLPMDSGEHFSLPLMD